MRKSSIIHQRRIAATVEVRTGEKSVLDYLLKPVLRSREALRER